MARKKEKAYLFKGNMSGILYKGRKYLINDTTVPENSLKSEQE